MIKIFNILFILFGIVSNAFSSNQISFSIPPPYYFNTWTDNDNNWTEFYLSNEFIIKDCSIVYTWTDAWPEKLSFNVLSPSGTKETVACFAAMGYK